MKQDIDLPIKIKNVLPADPKHGFPTDEICDENFPENKYIGEENAARQVLLELCGQNLDRKLKNNQIIKLPIPVSGHDFFMVYQLHGQSFFAKIEGNRREIVTAGLTVKLGDMAGDAFVPSEYSYVAIPPMPDWIIQNHTKKSAFYKIL